MRWTKPVVAGLVLMVAGVARADLLDFGGRPVEVDYWADDGSLDPANETIVVIDWNDTHGPYVTESHAWGYRWSGTGTLLEALSAIDAAGGLDVTISAAGFLNHAEYLDVGIDGDQHRTTDYGGWCWTASSPDGGGTWDLNLVGADAEPLGHGQIEAVNWNPGDWTGSNFTIPVPEPGTLSLLLVGAVWCGRRR